MASAADIVDLCRAWTPGSNLDERYTASLVTGAADEIEELRKQLTDLRLGVVDINGVMLGMQRDIDERDKVIDSLRLAVRGGIVAAEELDFALTLGKCQAPSGEGTHCALETHDDGHHVDRNSLNWHDRYRTGESKASP